MSSIGQFASNSAPKPDLNCQFILLWGKPLFMPFHINLPFIQLSWFDWTAGKEICSLSSKRMEWVSVWDLRDQLVGSPREWRACCLRGKGSVCLVLWGGVVVAEHTPRRRQARAEHKPVASCSWSCVFNPKRAHGRQFFPRARLPSHYLTTRVCVRSPTYPSINSLATRCTLVGNICQISSPVRWIFYFYFWQLEFINGIW